MREGGGTCTRERGGRNMWERGGRNMWERGGNGRRCSLTAERRISGSKMCLQ